MFCFLNTKKTLESGHSSKKIVCFTFNLICKITEHLLLRDVISANYIDSFIAAPSRHWVYHWYHSTVVQC